MVTPDIELENERFFREASDLLNKKEKSPEESAREEKMRGENLAQVRLWHRSNIENFSSWVEKYAAVFRTLINGLPGILDLEKRGKIENSLKKLADAGTSAEEIEEAAAVFQEALNEIGN